jgi:hypothetical protein
MGLPRKTASREPSQAFRQTVFYEKIEKLQFLSSNAIKGQPQPES